MATPAGDGDREFVAARHDGAIAQRELPHRHAGPVVHAEHRVAGEALEQAVVDHALRAGPAYFGRLEDQVHRAVEALVIREKVSRQDLAKMVGASREMVSRVMRDFDDKGFIRTLPNGATRVIERRGKPR